MSVAPQRPDADAAAASGGRGRSIPIEEVSPSGARRLGERHVCWLYSDRADFGRAAVAFLGLGLARDDRAQLVVSWPSDETHQLVGSLDGAAAAIEAGALEIVGPDELELAVDPLDRFRFEAERARVDGYRGVTVAVDATPWVIDHGSRTRFLAHEHELDRWITRAPSAVLCGYDHDQVGDDALGFAALHPEANQVVDFQIVAAEDGWLRITGAVDALNVHLFEEVVRGAFQGSTSPVNVDARELQYINQRGILALDALADRVNLVTGDAQIVRLAGSLQVTHLEVMIG